MLYSNYLKFHFGGVKTIGQNDLIIDDVFEHFFLWKLVFDSL